MNARVPFFQTLRSRSRTGDPALVSACGEYRALGRTLAENSGQFFKRGRRKILRAEWLVTATGGTAGLKGEHAPVGALNEVAGISVSGLREPIWCLAHEEALLEAMSCGFQTGTGSGRATETYNDAVH
jgi:hypothetical protein